MSGVEFEFVIPGPPLSVNTAKSQPKKHRDWQQRLRDAAKTQWATDQRPPSLLPTRQPVEVRITTYFSALALDVDNVIKPILDSLKGVIYQDDRQIYHLTSIRVDLTSAPIFESPTLLIEALRRYSEFVHIELSWEEI